MRRGKLLNNRRIKCKNNGRLLRVSFIYWCRSAPKAMNPVVLSHGHKLILIYFMCATERWSSIVGCSKKYAVWIWSIHLSSFVFCVTVLFGLEKKTFRVWKIHVKRRGTDWGPGLGSGVDRVMQFHLHHRQKHYDHSKHTFFFYLRSHIWKSENKSN